MSCAAIKAVSLSVTRKGTENAKCAVLFTAIVAITQVAPAYRSETFHTSVLLQTWPGT